MSENNQGNVNEIAVTLHYAGEQPLRIRVPENTDIGHIRTLEGALQELGAPSVFSFGVNGVGVSDTHILQDGDEISFRPLTGSKG